MTRSSEIGRSDGWLRPSLTSRRVAVLAATALVAGVIYAQVPYRLYAGVANPPLWSVAKLQTVLMFGISVLLALLSRSFTELGILAFGGVAGIFVGALGDAAYDFFARHHDRNLFGLELAFLIAVAIPGAFAGTATGLLIRRIWRVRRTR